MTYNKIKGFFCFAQPFSKAQWLVPYSHYKPSSLPRWQSFWWRAAGLMHQDKFCSGQILHLWHCWKSLCIWKYTHTVLPIQGPHFHCVGLAWGTGTARAPSVPPVDVSSLHLFASLLPPFSKQTNKRWKGYQEEEKGNLLGQVRLPLAFPGRNSSKWHSGSQTTWHRDGEIPQSKCCKFHFRNKFLEWEPVQPSGTDVM